MGLPNKSLLPAPDEHAVYMAERMIRRLSPHRSAEKALRNQPFQCREIMKAILPLAFVFLASMNPSLGDTMLFDIHSPKECGESVRVETKASRRGEGLVSVSLIFKPTVPDLYRDRVKAFGVFVVKSGEETIAVSQLESAGKEGVFTFTFELARDAFRNSELTLSSQLFGKDGKPTLGGGEVYRLHLRGFQPGAQTTAEPGAPPNGGPATPVEHSGGKEGRHR